MNDEDEPTRSIDERTLFLYAITPSSDQETEARRVETWIDREPELAAKYIVWLEDALQS